MKADLESLPTHVPRSCDGFESPSGIHITYSRDWVKQHPIEEDGLCAQLYQYIYKHTAGREEAMPPLYIPDTVVFDHNFPRAWYAYDPKTKEVMKRPGSMLDAQTMYDKFAVETVRGCEIVAQFFHTSVNVAEEWVSILTSKQKETNEYGDQQLTYVEFHTAASLRHFLFDQTRKPDGVLQKFVVPKGEGSSRRNFQLQVVWTPYITTVYRRTNRCRLNDHAVPLAERIATFDGSSYLSEETLVADETKHQVTNLCEIIARRFYATERKTLSRLILYVKSDDQNRLWVLWSSCVRVSADSMHPTMLRVPVCLNMRTELLNDGGSTVARLQMRRHRQRQLLALDAELFDVTHDFEFALALRSSHERQAKALGLHAYEGQPVPTRWCGAAQVPVATDHPLYPSFLELEVGGPTSAPGFTEEERAAAIAEAAWRESQAAFGGGSGAGADVLEEVIDPIAEVRAELIALAMDAWYAIYSTTLAEHPAVMSTARVELAAPLVGSLLESELQGLVEVLGLVPQEQNEGPTSDTGSGGVSRYQVASYLVTSGRRLDRPSAEVELDVVAYLNEVLAKRGEEIAKLCLEKYSSYF